MTSSVREVREWYNYASDLLYVLVLFAFVWTVSFCFRPLRTLKDTKLLVNGKYSSRGQHTDLDWIDEKWMRDRERR